MTEDHDRLDNHDSGNSPDQMKNSRRDFITKCLAAGGGLILYLTPKSNAYASQKQLSPGGPVFDIVPPAAYDVAGQRSTLQFQLPGAGNVNVEFDMNGSLALTDSGTPDVVDVEIVALSLTSVHPDPLGTVGVSCGRLQGQLNSTGAGQLNLRTGEYLPSPGFPIVTDSACGTGVDAVQVLSASVINSSCAPAKSFASCNCLNGNDVKVPVSAAGMPAGSQVVGNLEMCLVPRVA